MTTLYEPVAERARTLAFISSGGSVSWRHFLTALHRPPPIPLNLESRM